MDSITLIFRDRAYTIGYRFDTEHEDCGNRYGHEWTRSYDYVVVEELEAHYHDGNGNWTNKTRSLDADLLDYDIAEELANVVQRQLEHRSSCRRLGISYNKTEIKKV